MAVGWCGGQCAARRWLSSGAETAGQLLREVVAGRGRRWLVPHIAADSVEQVPYDLLRGRGMELVLYDKDNTLTVPYAKQLDPVGLRGLLRALRSGAKVAVLSNHTGTEQQDPDGRLAADFQHTIQTSGSTDEEQQLLATVRVIRTPAKKPFVRLSDIAEQLPVPGVSPAAVVMVGDRLLTDVLFANKEGMLAALVAPLYPRHPVLPFYLRHFARLERAAWLALHRRCALSPIAHSLHATN